MGIEAEGKTQRGRTNRRWYDSTRAYLREKGLSEGGEVLHNAMGYHIYRKVLLWCTVQRC